MSEMARHLFFLSFIWKCQVKFVTLHQYNKFLKEGGVMITKEEARKRLARVMQQKRDILKQLEHDMRDKMKGETDESTTHFFAM